MICLPLAPALYPLACACPGDAADMRRGQSTSTKHFLPARHSLSTPFVETKHQRIKTRFCDANRKGERGQRFRSAKCNIGSHDLSKEKNGREKIRRELICGLKMNDEFHYHWSFRKLMYLSLYLSYRPNPPDRTPPIFLPDHILAPSDVWHDAHRRHLITWRSPPSPRSMTLTALSHV